MEKKAKKGTKFSSPSSKQTTGCFFAQVCSAISMRIFRQNALSSYKLVFSEKSCKDLQYRKCCGNREFLLLKIFRENNLDCNLIMNPLFSRIFNEHGRNFGMALTISSNFFTKMS